MNCNQIFIPSHTMQNHIWYINKNVAKAIYEETK